MEEVLAELPAGSRVLDIGSGSGSFEVQHSRARIVRADLAPPARNSKADSVQCDATMLPFRDRSFRLVISNHSLEHFEGYERALLEIGRVLLPEGTLYVAVPDASSPADRLYRWLSRGGGHVNAFVDAAELAGCIEASTGLRHRFTQPLSASLSFANRSNSIGRVPRRLWVIGGGYEWPLILLVFAVRTADRWLGTRYGRYGWALYFGAVPAGVGLNPSAPANVCIRCGSGHKADWLQSIQAVRRFSFMRYYNCPRCEALNLYTGDE